MFARAIRTNRGLLTVATGVTGLFAITSTSPPGQRKGWQRQQLHQSYAFCEGSSNDENSRIRKRATVKKASQRVVAAVVQRSDTKAELSKIRSIEESMLERWERDEDGWRELPARAWPEYQPNPEQLKGIRVQAEKNNCNITADKSSQQQQQEIKPTDICQLLRFNIATSLVFYTDAEAAKGGFQQYEALAQHGHVDSMVACGVILVEGLAEMRNREAEGVKWLQQAVAQDSTQACHELGTVYYTGIDNVLEEDSEAAFALFQKAAGRGHVGALYMMADCLIEGEGTKVDVARAIPLLYQAADQGHRYARQRVRELLKKY